MLQQAIACFLFISLIQCNQNERSLLQAKKAEDGVIIDKVVFDSVGAVKSVDLINLGDKVALLEGWVLGGTGKLGQKGCDLEIQPSRTIVIMSLADNTTCGIDFSKISKSIQLASGDGTVVSDVEVDATGNENKAMVYAALPTKSDYLAVTEDAVSVLELMQQAGIFTIYLEALKGFGFDKVLQMGAPDPKYSGPHIPKRFQVKPENYSKPEVDWWEGKEGTVAPSSEDGGVGGGGIIDPHVLRTEIESQKSKLEMVVAFIDQMKAEQQNKINAVQTYNDMVLQALAKRISSQEEQLQAIKEENQNLRDKLQEICALAAQTAEEKNCENKEQ
eukprot:TRINITY_DN4953_c0_g1_i7.p1 TRINITY_DN4953_c0_g1~~TRINITY_DN4953_c0_g1_i7.p1  ORF type:complete len:332 (-),score=90.39 TRINITY_DN4953_c0_g1_i7:346-1341(-)